MLSTAQSYCPQWAILAPEKKLKVTVGKWFPNDTIFETPEFFNAWNLLMKPPKDTSKSLVPSLQSSTRGTSKSSKLEDLPLEVLFLIILNLEEVDAISLGFTNRNLWQLVLQHVHHSATTSNLTGSLAGVKLACCSRYAPDLPANFLENNLLKDTIIDNLVEKEDASSAGGLIRSCIANFDEVEHADFEQQWAGAFIKAVGNWNMKTPLDIATAKTLEAELTQCILLTWNMPVDFKYALRNLTAKEYVRIERLSLNSGTPYFTTMRGRNVSLDSFQTTVEDIIFLRACWNKRYEYDWTTMSNTDIYLRGPWAGHALDLVPMKDFEDDSKSQGQAWKDVTKDTAELVREACHKILRIRAHPLF
jgi:hypothetical protein